MDKFILGIKFLDKGIERLGHDFLESWSGYFLPLFFSNLSENLFEVRLEWGNLNGWFIELGLGLEDHLVGGWEVVLLIFKCGLEGLEVVFEAEILFGVEEKIVSELHKRGRVFSCLGLS